MFHLFLNELTQRFKSTHFGYIMSEMENLLVDSCNGRFKNGNYEDDIDMNKLKIQLSLLQDVLKTSNEGHKIGIKKVTMVKIVCDIFNVSKFSKTMLSEVDKVLKLYLILPLTSATAEQCFSSLCCLKSYLTSTMTQKHLNQLLLLYAHNDRVDQL